MCCCCSKEQWTKEGKERERERLTMWLQFDAAAIRSLKLPSVTTTGNKPGLLFGIGCHGHRKSLIDLSCEGSSQKRYGPILRRLPYSGKSVAQRLVSATNSNVGMTFEIFHFSIITHPKLKEMRSSPLFAINHDAATNQSKLLLVRGISNMMLQTRRAQSTLMKSLINLSKR